MILTKEQIAAFRRSGKAGFFVHDLVETIEAQQYEIEELKTQKDIWKGEFFSDSTDSNAMCKSLAAQRNEYQKEIELCKWLLHNHGKDNPKLSDSVRNILFENDQLRLELARMSGALNAIGKVALKVSKGDE